MHRLMLSLAVLLGSEAARACVVNETSESGEGVTVNWVERKPDDGSSKGVIYILPPTGGSTLIDRHYARVLCAQGFTTVLITGWTGDDDRSEDFERHSRHFAKANSVFSMVHSRYAGAAGYSILGTSLGGLYSLSIMNSRPEITRAVLITAGITFTDILTESQIDDLKRVRAVRKERFGLSSDRQYKAKLLESMAPFDDLSALIARAQEGRHEFLLVTGLEDDVVPTTTQTRLRDLVKPKRSIEIQAGHFWAIVRAYLFYFNDIKAFLNGGH